MKNKLIMPEVLTRAVLTKEGQSGQRLGTSNTSHESHTEAFYKFGVSEQFTLTIDTRLINNNSGNANSDTITVGGLRGQLNF